MNLGSRFFGNIILQLLVCAICPTVCGSVPERSEWDTCVWAGVDSVWEQEKLEARKMLENAAQTPTRRVHIIPVIARDAVLGADVLPILLTNLETRRSCHVIWFLGT